MCLSAIPGPRDFPRAGSLASRVGAAGGRGFSGPAPCPGEALATRAGRDDAPPQCSRGVGCPGCRVRPAWGPGLARRAGPLAGAGGWSGGRACRALPGPGVVSGGGVWEPGRGRFPAGLAGGSRGTEAYETRQGRAARGVQRAGKGVGPPACSPETTGAGSPWPGALPWRWSSNAAASDSASSATHRR